MLRLLSVMGLGVVLGVSFLVFVWVFCFREEFIMAQIIPPLGGSHWAPPIESGATFHLIESAQQIYLRFEIAGTLEWMAEQEVFISSGNVVARLDSRNAFLRLKKARLELEIFERFGYLCGSPLSPEELKAKVLQSEMDYQRTVLRAPRDGVLRKLFVKLGDTVTSETHIGVFAPAVRDDHATGDGGN